MQRNLEHKILSLHTGASTIIFVDILIIVLTFLIQGAYYAAQIGINLKTRDAASRDLLNALLGALEHTKNEIGPNDAIYNELASSAYVENFALKVFASADNEDRNAHATRCAYHVIILHLLLICHTQINCKEVLGCGQLS